MKTAGDLVARAFAAELTARVKRGHDGLKRRDFRLRMDAHRDTATIIYDAHIAARKERNLDIIREPAHGFVARVVEDFPDEVVETIGTCGADVHARALADRLKPLKDRDA